MTSDGAAVLRAAIEAAAAALGEVGRRDVDDAVELSRAGRPFARLQPAGVAFRLDRLIAAAALRTPDTAPSPLGAEWVAFAPAEIDRLALDRALAWLEAAWRRSAPASRT